MIAAGRLMTITRICSLIAVILCVVTTTKAHGKNTPGESQGSASQSTVLSRLPILLSPANGALNQEPDIDLRSLYVLQFSWYRYPDSVIQNGVPESPRIEVQIGTDSSFNSGNVIDSVYSASDTMPYARGLALNQKYYWHIRPQFSSGNGQWSEAWNFTTSASPKPYPPFTRTAPENGSAGYPLQIPRGGIPALKFSWNPYPNRTNDDGSQDKPYYLLQIDSDSAAVASGQISSKIFGSADSLGHTLTSTAYKMDAKYFWRMRAGYTIGGTPWSAVWSFIAAAPQATVHQMQFADSSSLRLADSLQSQSLPRYQQSRLQNYFYTAVVRCVVPPGTVTKSDSAIFVCDTAGVAQPWRGIMVQVDPWSSSPYYDYTTLGITDTKYLDTLKTKFSTVRTGDILSISGFITENPISGVMSNTLFLCTMLSVLDSSQQQVVPLQVSLSDFYNVRNVRFSTGEQFEGSVVEMHNLTVHSVLDANAGTFEMIDGSGNIMAMTDISRWFTLNGHRDPASTYSLPHPGAHINTIRGAIVTTGGRYCMAPLAPGDIALAPDPPHAITGYVYNDDNRDTVKNPGEAPMPQVRLTLSGKVQTTTLSDSTGMFIFSGLDSGSYSITCQSQEYPWYQTPDISGHTSVTFKENPETAKVSFGFFHPWNHVEGRIFEDLNENGIWNEGEPGVANKWVRLIGVTEDSAITDSSGHYSLNHVDRGTSYFSAVIQPPYEQILPRWWDQYLITPDTLGRVYSNYNFAVHLIPVRIKLLLTVHDDISTRVQQMYWGNRGGATYGIWGADGGSSIIDFSEQEEELPPVSFARSLRFFDARFQDPHTDTTQFGEGSWVDMRDFTSPIQADTHFVAFLPGYVNGGNYPMTIGWDKATVAASYDGDVYLLDPFGNATDMKNADSLVISNRGIGSVLLISNGPKLPSSSRMAWHLVSVPAPPLTTNVNDVFQLAKSDPYAYKISAGYVISRPMVPGIGYWLKCIPDKINSLSLAPAAALPETIAVAKGWNMIGAPGTIISTSNIASNPPGITGNIFSSKWVYENADSLRPFEGYWVKADQPGLIILGGTEAKRIAASDLLSQSVKIMFRNSSGNKGTLYVSPPEETATGKIDLSLFDLPPLPPGGAIDIRFASGRNLEAAPAGRTTDYPILISGDVYYPLALEIQSPIGCSGISISATIGTKTVSLSNTAGATIDNAKEPVVLHILNKQATVLPKEFRLEQNYPNPFNPATTIRYALPVQANVRLVIYNVLGQIVKTLADGVQEAGYKEIAWNASNNASGIYFYRIEAVPVETGQSPFFMIKKMILIK